MFSLKIFNLLEKLSLLEKISFAIHKGPVISVAVQCFYMKYRTGLKPFNHQQYWVAMGEQA